MRNSDVKKVMLTGHRGFIGTALLERLRKHNLIIGFDLLDGQDLFDIALLEEFDIIIHLAGKSGVRDSMDDPAGYWRNNVEVTKRLLARYPNTRILIASSSSIYEPHLNPYAASKYLIEQAAREHSNCLCMRFHTVYSDVPRKGMFLQKLIDGELTYITNHQRDFIHLDDLCEAIELCMISAYTGTIDIGTGIPVRMMDLVSDLPVKTSTPNERSFTCANTRKMELLGFKPKHSIVDFLHSNIPIKNNQ